MTLRTRDQVELVDAVIAFHLNAGVDFVLAVDHSSRDGTAEVLERYERDGYLRLLREEGEAIRLRRTEVARLAAAEYDADWVIHPDGDEFWWPRGGSWKEILALVPPRYGIVRGAWRHFAPRPDAGENFAERLVVRVSPYAERTGQEYPFHPGVKVAHRAHPRADVRKGHEATVPGLVPLRGWYPFEILHFPLRSLEQARRKYVDLARGLAAGGLAAPAHVERAQGEMAGGRWEEAYDELVVDGTVLESGLAAAVLAVDTRLRDALRVLAGCAELPLEPRFLLPEEGAPSLMFAPDGVAEEAAYAHDVQILQGYESDVRLQARIEALERRLVRIERGTTAGLLRRVVRRRAR